MGDPELSVIAPAYREEGTIHQSLTRMLAALEALGTSFEILVVSDGNTDRTVEEARSVADPRIDVIHYEHQRGKGFALRHGFSHCRGDLVAFIDADLDLHPDGIGRLIELMHQLGADAAIGSKLHPDSNVVYPPFRRFQSTVFRTLSRILFNLDVRDTQTGLKVFRREVLEAVMPEVATEGFTFDLDLLVLAHDAGFSIVEGPVELDFQFSSTTGGRAVVNMLREMLRIAARHRARRRTQRVRC